MKKTEINKKIRTFIFKTVPGELENSMLTIRFNISARPLVLVLCKRAGPVKNLLVYGSLRSTGLHG